MYYHDGSFSSKILSFNLTFLTNRLLSSFTEFTGCVFRLGHKVAQDWLRVYGTEPKEDDVEVLPFIVM